MPNPALVSVPVPSDAKGIRVFLIYDFEVIYKGLSALLCEMKGIEVVGCAKSGRDVFERVTAASPQVVLSQVGAQEVNGVELRQRLTRLTPPIPIIAFTVSTDHSQLLAAILDGVAGCLPPDMNAGEVHRAIRAVARGQSYIPPALSSLFLETLREQRRSGGRERLNCAQRDVMRLWKEGRRTGDIAKVLHMSTRSVEAHKTRIKEILGVRTAAGVIQYATREEMTSPQASVETLPS